MKPFAIITFPNYDPLNMAKGLGKPDVTFYGVDPSKVNTKAWGAVRHG